MKIIIADDHAVVRSGFMHLLNFQDDMEVIATAADGREAYELVSQYSPDVLLLDLSMPPGESGLITTGKIKHDFPDTKVIILTMYAEEEYLFNVLKNGASGYVLKKAPDEQLLTAIRTVHAGGTYIDPEMATSLVREVVNNKDPNESDPYQLLSQRELEVLPLAAKGYGNKEIAEMLFISVKTVEAHKANIMGKLNLKNRPELVEYAFKKEIINYLKLGKFGGGKMKKHTEFAFDLPALRIIENEHHLLKFLMEEWHPIVLHFEKGLYTEKEGPVALQTLRSKLEHFMKVLKKHMQKEETYLFPLLAKYVGDEQGPVVATEEEHEEIDAFLEHFFHHTEGDLHKLSIQQMKAITEDAGEAFEIITFHFIKEESVIFPMVEEILKPNEQYELFENMYSSII